MVSLLGRFRSFLLNSHVNPTARKPMAAQERTKLLSKYLTSNPPIKEPIGIVIALKLEITVFVLPIIVNGITDCITDPMIIFADPIGIKHKVNNKRNKEKLI